MKQIELTQGKFAIVDDEDFDKINQYRWRAVFNRNTWYAATGQTRDQTYWGMHEMILGFNESQIDHIDGNGLNNQKINLRFATHSQNTQKGKARKDNPQGLRGIYWASNCNKWRASIQVNHQRLNLGLYKEINDAIKAYNAASLTHFGEHGFQNQLIG